MTQTKTLIVSIVGIFAAFYATSQTTPRNPFIYNQNAFAIQYTSGFNKTQVTPTFGDDDRFLSSINQVHQLNLLYTFDLNPSFGLTFGAGIGMFPFNYELAKTEDFGGTTGQPKKYTRSYNPFSRLHFMVDYHKWIGQKLAFKGGLGGGFYKFTPNTFNAVTDPNDDQNFTISYRYLGEFTPNVTLQAGFDFKLKNDDLVGISLSYDYLFSTIAFGSYSIQSSEHRGFMTNSGNQFNINLSYSFTQAKKMLRMENGFNQEDLSLDEAKSKFKMEKRFIDPKSCFFGLSSGLFYSRNNVENTTYPSENTQLPQWVIHANGEKGLKNNFFAQVGLSVAKYTSLTLIHRPDFSVFYGSRPFIASSLSAGLGYRFITKNNKNQFNLSAGVSLIANLNSRELNTSSKSAIIDQNEEVLFYMQNVHQTKNNVVPTVYLNLGRDFQLTQSLYFSVDYRLNLGFIKSFEQDIRFYESPDFNVPLSNISSIKGTSNAFQVGLKYKFVPQR